MKQFIISAMRWLALSVISLVGAIAFMVFVGDKDPNYEMSLGMFILLKLVSVVVMILCAAGLFWLSETGNLPHILSTLSEEE